MSAEEWGEAPEEVEGEEPPDPDEPDFHGSYIVGSFEVVEPRWARLLRGIFDNPSTFVASVTAGSHPILGISVGEGSNRIDALVCRQATRVDVFWPGNGANRQCLSERKSAELCALCDEMFPDDELHHEPGGRPAYGLAPVPWNPEFDRNEDQRN